MRLRLLTTLGVLFVAGMAALSIPARADDPPPTDDMARLKAAVEAMKADLEALRRENEALKARIATLEGQRSEAKQARGNPPESDAKPVAPPTPPPSTDPFERTVQTYRAYTDAELRDPKHAVTIDMLFEIVTNDAASKAVRELAVETITWERAIVNDDALSREGKRGNSNRARFSEKVLPLLVGKDPYIRSLGKLLLEGLWAGWKPANPAIKHCDPRSLESCTSAAEEWKKIIANS